MSAGENDFLYPGQPSCGEIEF